MIPFGYTLKSAREAKGYTIGQIAEMTHMMSSMVQDLENENFSRLAAPIYGRGFVKLYCEAVGLDPKPLVSEFMDLYNGNHEPVIRERPVSAPIPAPQPAPIPAPIPAPQPAPQPEPVPERDAGEDVSPETDAAPETAAETADEGTSEEPDPDLERQDEAVEGEPRPQPGPSPLPDPVASEPPNYGVRQPGLFDPPAPEPPVANPPVANPPAPEMPAAKPTFARYASPLDDHYREPHGAFPTSSLWRWGVIAAGGLLVLWGVIAGLKALYRATTADSPDKAPASEARPTEDGVQAKPEAVRPPAASASRPGAQRKAPAKPSDRTPQQIPPLYMD